MPSPLAGQRIKPADYLSELAVVTAQVEALTASYGALPQGFLGGDVANVDQLVANDSSDFVTIGVAVNFAASRYIRVWFSGTMSSSSEDDVITLWIEEDGTPIASDVLRVSFADDNGDAAGFYEAILTAPPAGLHEFFVAVSRPFGTGTGGYRAGGHIGVEDMGAVG